jgi:hypothetical protein
MSTPNESNMGIFTETEIDNHSTNHLIFIYISVESRRYQGT